MYQLQAVIVFNNFKPSVSNNFKPSVSMSNIAEDYGVRHLVLIRHFSEGFKLLDTEDLKLLDTEGLKLLDTEGFKLLHYYDSLKLIHTLNFPIKGVSQLQTLSV